MARSALSSKGRSLALTVIRVQRHPAPGDLAAVDQISLFGRAWPGFLGDPGGHPDESSRGAATAGPESQDVPKVAENGGLGPFVRRGDT